MRYFCVVCSMVHIFSLSMSFVEGFPEAETTSWEISCPGISAVLGEMVDCHVCALRSACAAWSTTSEHQPVSRGFLKATPRRAQAADPIQHRLPSAWLQVMFIIYDPGPLIQSQYFAPSPALQGILEVIVALTMSLWPLSHMPITGSL